MRIAVLLLAALIAGCVPEQGATPKGKETPPVASTLPVASTPPVINPQPANVDSPAGPAGGQVGGDGKTVHVKGHTTKAGVYVPPHDRRPPSTSGRRR